jgi:hypothetical protein
MTFTPDQRQRLREAAQRVLDARAEGKPCQKLAIEWAEWVLKMNPDVGPPVAFDDELPESMVPVRVKLAP